MDELPRKYLPALAWYRPFEPYAYALIRFCIGLILLAHGAARVFYSGSVAELGPYLRQLPAGAIGAFELVGGVMITLGLLTRPVALLFMIEWLFVAAAIPHKAGDSWLMLGATEHFAALIATICFAFLMRGGGHYSLDRRIGKEF